jgi:hypothetical protein
VIMSTRMATALQTLIAVLSSGALLVIHARHLVHSYREADSFPAPFEHVSSKSHCTSLGSGSLLAPGGVSRML